MKISLLIKRYWEHIEKQERKGIYMVSIAALLYLVHYLVFCIPQPFFIEDAGISFAYARNAALGEGFVGYLGGERVEGFSNPLWTFLIALLYFIGLDPWISAKILGAGFGILTLFSVYGVTRRLSLGILVSTTPCFMLALSTQFVVWNTSGLENSLYGLLLCTGMWRLLVEEETQHRYPLSALCFALAAITRPEGIMYGVIALVIQAIFSVQKRAFLSLLSWLAIFALPIASYFWWRYSYFAWELPNTYYAKLGKGNQFQPFSWTTKGWKYIHDYLGLTIQLTASGGFKELAGHGLGYVLPLLGVALAGVRSKRFSFVMLWMLPMLFFLPLDVSLKEETFLGDLLGKTGSERTELSTLLVKVKVGWILLTATLLGLMNIGQQGWKARCMLWAMGSSSVFFVLYSGGDWMDQFRWFHTVELFFFPIFVEGLFLLFQSLSEKEVATKWKHVFWIAPAVLFTTIEVMNSTDFAMGPETSVNDIHRRVRYMRWVQQRLDVDDVTLLDVDMGAHMYYSGWDIVDIAGLIDVPMAQHSDYNFAFVRHYLFEERNPEFAHCHGGWAKTSKIDKHKEWKERYLELPGYPVGGRTLHIGNNIRKDLFIQPYDASQYPQSIQISEGLSLSTYFFSALEVPAGGLLYFYTAWHSERENSNVQAFVILVDEKGALATVASLQPGFGWYPREDWKPEELIEGKFRIPIPTTLPTGSYSVRLAVVEHQSGIAYGKERTDYVFLPQEFDIEGTVVVVPKDDAYKAAQKEIEDSFLQAEEGHCDRVWPLFKKATRHVLRDQVWRERREKAVRNALATCLMKQSDQSPEEEKIDLLQRARKWNHHVEGLIERSAPLAKALDEKGQELFAQAEAKDSYILSKKIYEEAYQNFLDAIRLDPSLSWTRRRLEDARDKFLHINRPTTKKKPKKNKASPKKNTKTNTNKETK